MEDRYRSLRELPFDVAAAVLGIELRRFRIRKGGLEMSGPCPIHGAKKNGTAFSYALDGKFGCISRNAKPPACHEIFV